MSSVANARSRILIRNLLLVSMDPTVGDMRNASLLIEGDRIAAIARNLEADGATVIDGEGAIALPGLIDAHRHLWQGALTMAAADTDLNDYFGNVLAKLAPSFEADDVYIGNLAGALQALESGITTLYDWSHVQNTPAHTDAAIEALKHSGLRAIFAYAYPGLGPEWFFESRNKVPEDIRRVRRELLNSDDGLVTMAMGLRGPEMSTIEVTASDLAVARELGLRASLHVGNGAFGVPYRSIEKMHEARLLGPDLLYVHCNSLTDQAIRHIAETGGAMVATPTVEMQMQFGWPASTRFLACGIRPALGVDVVTSTDAGLFAQMACTFQAARLQALEHGTPSVTVRDVLGFATIDAARALGIEATVGSLAPGKQADIILLRPSSWLQLNDPVGFAVLGASAQSVDTVIVGGVVKKQAGRLTEHDPSAISHRRAASLERLTARSGLTMPVALI